MRNKKGMETRTAFLGIALMMFLIAIYFLYITGAGGELLARVGIILPDFNNNQSLPSSIEIVRYDILNDKVEWYDGVDWWDFEQGKAVLGEKELAEEVLKGEFASGYYYNSNLRNKNKLIELDVKASELIFTSQDIQQFSEHGKTPPLLNLFIIGMQSPDGRLSSVLKNKLDANDRKIYGEMVLKADGSLTLNKLKYDYSGLSDELIAVPSNSELYNFIFPELVLWRNSIYTNPITISYKSEDIQKSDTYCVKEYNSRFLAVDLTKPRTQC